MHRIRNCRWLVVIAAALLSGCDQPDTSIAESSVAAKAQPTSPEKTAPRPPTAMQPKKVESASASETSAPPKPALRLALPDEPEAATAAAPSGLLLSNAPEERRNRFDRADKRSAVEWDGNLDLQQDSPLSKPRLDGVEVQMKSQF